MPKRPFLVTLLLVGTACGGEQSGDTRPKAGTITLELSNPTSADVYIDTTFGLPYAIERNGKSYSTGHDCTPTCGSACDCYFCGAPMPRVRRIAPGASVQVTWAGVYYELENGCGDMCQCERAHDAEFADYTVTMLGARGRSPSDGPALSSDPDSFEGTLDNSSGDCAAMTTVTLDQTDKTVTVPFSCTL